MERVQDDVEIETEGQSDAFAVCSYFEQYHSTTKDL